MPKVDNDETKRIAKPFIVLANVRTGGTFLAHCLSNHPQVHCDRGETIHHGSIWRKRAIAMPVSDLIYLLTHQEGYHASGFRMIYKQAFDPRVWPHILSNKCKIIHLYRENVLRQAVSWLFQQRVRHGKEKYFPVHSFKSQEPPKVELDPAAVVEWCARLQTAVDETRHKIAKLDVLELEYAALTGGEGVVTDKVSPFGTYHICDFLSVEEISIQCELKRVTAFPLRAMLTNWKDVRDEVKKSPFAEHLADEVGWKKSGKGWVRNG